MKDFNEFLKTIDFEKLYNHSLDSTGMMEKDTFTLKETLELHVKASQSYTIKLLEKYHDWVMSQE